MQLVANVEQKTQRFIPVSESGNSISALSISPDRHVFAVAESSERPNIHIYDLHNFRKRRQLTLLENSVAKVLHINSSDLNFY